MAEAMNNKKISGDGEFTKKVNTIIEQKYGAYKALFVTSGSAALDMAAILLDLQEGDEVIVPSYTFVSTANSIILRGAKPVFAEVNPNTMNVEPLDIQKKITSKTKAIWPVHYAGVGCDMDKIMEIANENDVWVVEDAAQGVNAKYKDKYLGTIGHIGCYSYHDTKNYTCGEGGHILINDPRLAERAEIVLEKGTDRKKFFRGEIDKYSWVDIGTSFLGSELLAAFLLAQLEQANQIQNRREYIFNKYYNAFKELEMNGIIKRPYIPEESNVNYHMFYIMLENKEHRNFLMKKLKDKGINSVFHYMPLHSSEMGVKMGYSANDLPITEEYAHRLLRMPLFVDMTDEEINYVIDKMMQISEDM